MANPQKENGYTAIANEILEALCWYRISGEEHLVLNVIIRKTYGFQKKSDHIALTQFTQMTRLKKPTVQRALTKLLSKKIIVIKKDNQIGNVYSINKDFDSWERLSKKITNKKVVIKKDNLRLSKKRHTKETITKERKVAHATSSKSSMRKSSFRHNEKNTSDHFEDVIDYDTGELVQDPADKTSPTIKLLDYWEKKCKQARIVTTPPRTGAEKNTAKRVVNMLSDEHITNMIKDWFDSGREDKDLISINKCFSNNEVTRYKVDNGLK